MARPNSTCSGGSSIASQPFGWHIVLHFDAKDLPDYADLLDRMPCPYVIDHMARVPTADGVEQEPFQALLELMADERAWVKISGAERLTADGPPPYDDVVPVRPGAHRGGPRSGAVGHRLAASRTCGTCPTTATWSTCSPTYAPDEATGNRILVTNPETALRLRLRHFSHNGRVPRWRRVHPADRSPGRRRRRTGGARRHTSGRHQ